MEKKYTYVVPASPNKRPELRAMVEQVSATGWCARVEGEAISEPRAETTLEGAMLVAISLLNRTLSEYGAPQMDPARVAWLFETSSVPPRAAREEPGLGRKLKRLSPGPKRL